MGTVYAEGGLSLNAGYLTIEKTIDLENKEYGIRIPNQEVISEFKALTAHYLCVDTRELTELYKSIIKKNKDMFLKSYENLLLVNPSYYDLTSENSYQAQPAVRMLLLGICLYIKNDYEIISNREAGKGRCDLILKAKKQTLPSYVIEFRYCAPMVKYMKKNVSENHSEALKQLAQEAIQQIEKQKYDNSLTGEIIHIGLAHAGKEIAMEWKVKE